MAPGVPHHITQRGSRRQQTFFCEEDYKAYLHLMAEWCSRWKVEVWAYCLMPNHVHLIAVPPSKEALTGAVAETHRRYTCRVNLREGWTGHLWQGRFSSFPLDEARLYTAASCIKLNPCGEMSRASAAPPPADHVQECFQAGDDAGLAGVLVDIQAKKRNTAGTCFSLDQFAGH